MMQLLIGMLLGAMVSTPTGRSIGNQIGDAALKKVKGRRAGVRGQRGG